MTRHAQSAFGSTAVNLAEAVAADSRVENLSRLETARPVLNPIGPGASKAAHNWHTDAVEDQDLCGFRRVATDPANQWPRRAKLRDQVGLSGMALP